MDNYAARGYMRTASGWVNLLEPTVDMIHFTDIIDASRRIRRFNGHSPVTLIEHSCRVHDILNAHFSYNDITLRQGLMHDAHEVYVADLPSPMKAALRTLSKVSTYDGMEDTMARVVAEKFGFPYPLPDIVKEADMIALAIEADLTWGDGTAETWGLPRPISGYRYNDGDLLGRLVNTQHLAVPAPRIEGTSLAQQAFEGRVAL